MTEEQLDAIEKWLRDAPTHPQVQYACSYQPQTLREVSGFKQASVTRIKPVVVQTWDSLAMLAEWDEMRQQIEKGKVSDLG